MADHDLKPVLDEIHDLAASRERIQLMEVCGTHTVSLFRTGVRSMLPANLELVSGPGCPVCVTSQGYLDAACELAGRDGVAVCTYGDMVRVPGRQGSLEDLRARGATVQVVYSARDALAHARKHPDRQTVFLAVGFETTTPATAAMIAEAKRTGVTNLTILPGHKLVIPAMETLLSAGQHAIDGFLCPGHVTVILGLKAYRPIVERFGAPCVVGGFEAEGMLRAILLLVRQVVAGEARCENAYSAAVTEGGNARAWQMIEAVFEPADADWRAMGTIPLSGLDLRSDYADFDARRRFDTAFGPDEHPAGCRCGEVIQGLCSPRDCPLFATACDPQNPVGPCMVSSEGACAAWYKYGRR